jgi:hypothetical protein
MTATLSVGRVGHLVDLQENLGLGPKEMAKFLRVRTGRNQAEEKSRNKTVPGTTQSHGETERIMGEGDIGGPGAGQGMSVIDIGIDRDPETADDIGSMGDTESGPGAAIVEGGTTVIEATEQRTLKQNAEGRLPEIELGGRGVGHPITSTTSRSGRRLLA